MDHLVLQFPGALWEMAFTLALVAGAVLLIGMILSLGVFAYRSTKGEGVPDPEEVVPEKIDDDTGVTEGDADDEWKYY